MWQELGNKEENFGEGASPRYQVFVLARLPAHAPLLHQGDNHVSLV